MDQAFNPVQCFQKILGFSISLKWLYMFQLPQTAFPSFFQLIPPSNQGSHSDRVPEDEALMLRRGSRTACVGQQVPAEESEVRS